jgi:hypothetical protein
MGTGPYFNFKDTSKLKLGAFFVFIDCKEFSTTYLHNMDGRTTQQQQ